MILIHVANIATTGVFKLHIQSAGAFSVILKKRIISAKAPIRHQTAAVFVVSAYDKWFQPYFDFTTLSI